MKKRGPTADMLSNAIKSSGLIQREIAEQAGFSSANTVSMKETGEARVPIERIPPIAELCGVDPARMLRTAMEEYAPETWSVLNEHLGTPLGGDEEAVVRAYIRDGRGRRSGPRDPDPAGSASA